MLHKNISSNNDLVNGLYYHRKRQPSFHDNNTRQTAMDENPHASYRQEAFRVWLALW